MLNKKSNKKVSFKAGSKLFFFKRMFLCNIKKIGKKKQVNDNIHIKLLQESVVKFCNTSTVHGLNQIVRAGVHPLERFVWFAIVIILIYFAINLGLVQVYRYVYNPTVVSIKKNFRDWTTIFPAVTVCLSETVDIGLAKDFIERTWNITELDEKYAYYSDYIQLVTSVSFRSNVRQFWKYEKDATFHGIELMSIISAVLPQSEIRTTLHDVDHKVVWESVMTEMGLCKTFNSLFSRYQSVETWKLKIENKYSISPEVDKRELLTCNYMNGKCYARFSLLNTTGKYYVHSPYEVAEFSANPTEVIEEGEELEAEYRSSSIQAGVAVRPLTIGQRGCKYPDEPISASIPAYSNALCQMECRSRMSIAFCGCRPFFYIIGDGKPCDTKGMSCIGRNMEILINLPINLAKCSCVPQCTEINYIPHSKKMSMWNSSYPSVFERKASVKYSLKMPKVKMHKDLIFTFNDLIASFGGTSTLFLGISFISIVEILIFITKTIGKLVMIVKCKYNRTKDVKNI